MINGVKWLFQNPQLIYYSRLRLIFFPAIFRLSPLMHLRKVVSGFGKKIFVSNGVKKPGRIYMRLTDRYDITIVVKMSLNSNAIKICPCQCVFLSFLSSFCLSSSYYTCMSVLSCLSVYPPVCPFIRLSSCLSIRRPVI